MTCELLPYLNRRVERFCVAVNEACDPRTWVVNDLLRSPAATASLAGIAYTIAATPIGFTVNFGALYCDSREKCFVFLARDDFELTCAISLVLRKHLNLAKIVIDNRSTFVGLKDIFAKMHLLRKTVGEDLETGQAVSSQSSTVSLCAGAIVVYTLKVEYFERPEALNALTCVVAEHARAARNKVGNNPTLLANELLRWFRENVQYRNTGTNADHSAAGLIRNGTAVCQGIAVYAHQFFWSCGIKARYVIGMGRHEDHAWNVAKVGGKWRHIDYTFALPGHCKDIFNESEIHFCSCHKWNVADYSATENDRVANIKETLAQSVISAIPESNCYSVNGCIVDTSNIGKMCVVRDGMVYLSIADLFQDLGGGYAIARDTTTIVYGARLYKIPSSALMRLHGRYYLTANMMHSLGIEMQLGDLVLNFRPV